MISEELLQGFIAEASDLLDDVEPSLVEYSRLKEAGERIEIVNRVFRHFHSIKGSAGFVGLHNIARLTHEAETLLEQFRKFPDKVISQENIALLCRTVDLLRAIFDSGGGGEEKDREDDASIDSLIREISLATQSVKGGFVREQPFLADAAAHEADPEKPLPQGAFAGGSPGDPAGGRTAVKPDKDVAGQRSKVLKRSSDTARVIHTGNRMRQDSPRSTEFVGRYVAEANELLEQIEQSLLHAEQHPDSSADSIQEALRCLHSFKGNSGFMNLADLELLSHRMESEVEASIDRSLGLDSQVFDALLQMIDVLRQGVADFSCGGSGRISEADAYIAMLDEMFKAQKTETRTIGYPAGDAGMKGRAHKTATVGVLRPSPESAAPHSEPGAKTGSEASDSSTQEIFASPDAAKRKNRDTTHLVLRDNVTQQIDLRSVAKSESINIAAPPPTQGQGTERPTREISRVRGPGPRKDAGMAGGKDIEKSLTDTAQRRRNAEQLAARNDIRVDLRKLDEMLNLVGELVIAEAMVTRHPVVWNAENESLERAVHQLRRVAGALQDMATSVRMIPLAPTFRRMTRLVYDLSVKAGKQIDLILLGEETEVDRTVIERISDPLVHIIRNAIDHGIEPPEERALLGKSEVGKVTIEGHHEGGEVWIVITDDGRGLDKQAILQKAISRGMISGDGSDLTDNQIYHFVFEPGFSTAAKVTDISGRGFGMDVVKKNIEKLSGRIDIRTRPGDGTVVVLRIPLTLAIIEGMLIRSGETRYIIPLLSIRESLRPDMAQIMSTPDGQALVKIRDELVPIVKLDETFSRVKSAKNLEDGILMIVEGEDGDVVALFADELLGQQETVIKGLSGWLKKSRGVSGCTILGDGEVGLILDIGAIVRLARQKSSA